MKKTMSVIMIALLVVAGLTTVATVGADEVEATLTTTDDRTNTIAFDEAKIPSGHDKPANAARRRLESQHRERIARRMTRLNSPRRWKQWWISLDAAKQRQLVARVARRRQIEKLAVFVAIAAIAAVFPIAGGLVGAMADAEVKEKPKRTKESKQAWVNEKLSEADQMMFDRLVAPLLEGKFPSWSKPWRATTSSGVEVTADVPFCADHDSMAHLGYNGGNRFWLWLIAGGEAPIFATKKQWAKVAKRVSKATEKDEVFPVISENADSTVILKPKQDKSSWWLEPMVDRQGEPILKKNGEPKMRKIFKIKQNEFLFDEVFHVSQTNLDLQDVIDLVKWDKKKEASTQEDEKKPDTPESMKDAQALVVAYQENVNVSRVNHGGNRAFYQPTRDAITMPHPDDFKGDDSTKMLRYAQTLTHEFIHATGHQSRLARPMMNGFGSKDYAIEELVAEMGSVISMSMLGLEAIAERDALIDVNEQSGSYLRGWALKAVGVKDPENLTDDEKAAWRTACMKMASKAIEASNLLVKGIVPEHMAARGRKAESEDKPAIPDEVMAKYADLEYHSLKATEWVDGEPIHTVKTPHGDINMFNTEKGQFANHLNHNSDIQKEGAHGVTYTPNVWYGDDDRLPSNMEISVTVNIEKAGLYEGDDEVDVVYFEDKHILYDDLIKKLEKRDYTPATSEFYAAHLDGLCEDGLIPDADFPNDDSMWDTCEICSNRMEDFDLDLNYEFTVYLDKDGIEYISQPDLHSDQRITLEILDLDIQKIEDKINQGVLYDIHTSIRTAVKEIYQTQAEIPPKDDDYKSKYEELKEALIGDSPNWTHDEVVEQAHKLRIINWDITNISKNSDIVNYLEENYPDTYEDICENLGDDYCLFAPFGLIGVLLDPTLITALVGVVGVVLAVGDTSNYDAICKAWRQSKEGVKVISESYCREYGEQHGELPPNTDFVLPNTSWKIAREIAASLGLDESYLHGNNNASAWFFIGKEPRSGGEPREEGGYLNYGLFAPMGLVGVLLDPTLMTALVGVLGLVLATSNREWIYDYPETDYDGNKWSDEQEHILSAFSHHFAAQTFDPDVLPPARMVIESVAGSGKTTILRAIIDTVHNINPNARLMASAFNRSIAGILKDVLIEAKKDGFNGATVIGGSNSVQALGYRLLRDEGNRRGVAVNMEGSTPRYRVLSRMAIGKHLGEIYRTTRGDHLQKLAAARGLVNQLVRQQQDLGIKTNSRKTWFKLATELQRICEVLMDEGFKPHRSHQRASDEMKSILDEAGSIRGVDASSGAIIWGLGRHVVSRLAYEVLIEGMTQAFNPSLQYPKVGDKMATDIIIPRPIDHPASVMRAHDAQDGRFDVDLYPLYMLTDDDDWNTFRVLGNTQLLWPPRDNVQTFTPSKSNGEWSVQFIKNGSGIVVNFSGGQSAIAQVTFPDGSSMRAVDSLKAKATKTGAYPHRIKDDDKAKVLVAAFKKKWGAKCSLEGFGDEAPDEEIPVNDENGEVTLSFTDQVWLPHVLDIRASEAELFDVVLIDEVQDLSFTKGELIRRVCGDHTSIVFVGDRKQSIMQFAGARASSMTDNAAAIDADEYSMTVCWRGTHEVASHARKTMLGATELVRNEWGDNADIPDYQEHQSPSIEGWPQGEKTLVMPSTSVIDKVIALREANADTTISIICRMAAPLGEYITGLVLKGVPIKTPSTNGGLVKDVITLAKKDRPADPTKVNQTRVGLGLREGRLTESTVVRHVNALNDYLLKQAIQRAGNDASAAAKEPQYNEQVDLLNLTQSLILLALEKSEADSMTIDEVENWLKDILFSDSENAVALSTVHRYKGEQAEYVFCIISTMGEDQDGKPTTRSCFMLNHLVESHPINAVAEANILYVAMTRAKKQTIMVFADGDEALEALSDEDEAEDEDDFSDDPSNRSKSLSRQFKDCDCCDNAATFVDEDLPTGERAFCSERCWAIYSAMPVRDEGYYGFIDGNAGRRL